MCSTHLRNNISPSTLLPYSCIIVEIVVVSSMSHRASLATARGIHLWNCWNVCMECIILYSSGNKITVNGAPVLFQIDTGARVTLINLNDYNGNTLDCELSESNVKLRAYTGNNINVVGQCDVTTELAGQCPFTSSGGGGKWFSTAGPVVPTKAVYTPGQSVLSQFGTQWSRIAKCSTGIQFHAFQCYRITSGRYIAFWIWQIRKPWILKTSESCIVYALLYREWVRQFTDG